MNKTTTLHCTEAGSDKIYVAMLEQQPCGNYAVNFQYGRRGSTLKAGSKTATPLPLADATKVLEKLILSKVRKGYVVQDGDTVTSAAVGLERAGRDSGLRPQLLTSVDRECGRVLATGTTHMMQEKHNGERRMLVIEPDGTVTGINRTGLAVALPEPIATAASALAHPDGRIILDGEEIGDQFIAFDMLEDRGEDITPQGTMSRFDRLLGLLPFERSSEAVRRTLCWLLPEAKQKHFKGLEAQGAEGVVFKHKHAPYMPGRDPEVIKVKFVETATCRVAGQTKGKRSVALELADQPGRWQGIGNVTVLANQSIPAIGALVEVRYLYAHRGGSLIQPVLMRERNDVDESACTTTQLKFKAEPLAA